MTTASCLCMFSALYAPSMGGVEAYTAALAAELTAQGHRVIVVTCALDEKSGISHEGGADVVRLPSTPALGGRYPIPRRDEDALRLWRWLDKQPIDAIVVHTRFYPLSCAGLAFARRHGIVPVLIEHGSAHLTMGNAVVDAGVRAVEHATTARVKRFRPRCYGVSRKASAWLSHFNIESCGELSNAIDADAYAALASARDFRKELGIPTDSLLIASAGRLVPEKGVGELATAVQLLRQQSGTPRIDAIVAGAGPLERELRSVVSDRLHLVGKISRRDIAALLAQADALCLPSRSEGFATTLLEAASCGTPAIVTPVGGTDELIPTDEFGTVIPDREPETIAAALANAARNRTALHIQGAAAAHRVRERYSWKQTAQLTLEACRIAQRD